MRLIDADVVKEYFCAACSTPKRYQRTIEECRNHTDSYGNRCFKMRLIDNTLSVSLDTLRPKGRWVHDDHFPSQCSECGMISPGDCELSGFYDSNFCPNDCWESLRETIEEYKRKRREK